MPIKRSTRIEGRRARRILEPPLRSQPLRLADPVNATDTTARRTGTMGQPITSAADPRWVLAVRTAEHLQGSILTPDQRPRLVNLGRLMGLTPFDANLIIAIVQDQARRGYEPDYCPTAGEPQLSLIPLPRRTRIPSMFHGRRALTIAAVIASIIAFELLALKLLLF